MSSALIDTNLLILLVVGSTNRAYISSHKRTKTFTERDYDELVSILKGYPRLWVTSHCLAEASNLLKQTSSERAPELLAVLSQICRGVKESHVSKDRIFSSKYYLRLGVADTGFIHKSRRVSCSFTADLDLYLSILEVGAKVINFNHLRSRYLYP